MKSASDWTNSSLASENLHPSETTGRTIRENENGLWSVCQEENLTVFAAPLKHRIECFGYVIREKQHPGKLDPNLLKQKGIPPGPLYSKIKEGEAITAPSLMAVLSCLIMYWAHLDLVVKLFFLEIHATLQGL